MSTEFLIQALHLAAPIVALAVMCLTHTVLSRLRPEAPLLNMLALSGVFGLVALLGVEVLVVILGGAWVTTAVLSVFVDGPIYGCLAYGYANFVNLGYASVRVRIYRELLVSPGGIPVAILREQYDEEGMLVARLERLVEARDFVRDGTRYRLNKRRLSVISWTIFTLKKIILGRASEFLHEKPIH